MRALTWHGKRSVSLETVPGPVIRKKQEACRKVVLKP